MGRGDFGVEPPARTCNCKSQPNRQSHMLPSGEYKRGVAWTCHSDSAFCQITVVLVIHWWFCFNFNFIAFISTTVLSKSRWFANVSVLFQFCSSIISTGSEIFGSRERKVTLTLTNGVFDVVSMVTESQAASACYREKGIE